GAGGGGAPAAGGASAAGGGGGGGGRRGEGPPPPPPGAPSPPRAAGVREQSPLAVSQGAAHARQHLACHPCRVAALGVVRRGRVRDRMQHHVVELGGGAGQCLHELTTEFGRDHPPPGGGHPPRYLQKHKPPPHLTPLPP